MKATEFVTHLKNVKRAGQGFMACCPSHNDKTPSLSVKDVEDRILLKDFGQGCTPEEIVAAVGLDMRDLFHYPAPHKNHHRGGPPRAVSAVQIAERLEFIESRPTPLPPPLPPVPNLDDVILPAGLQLWITDIADRMQCPLDFPAIAALTSAGALIGNRVAVKPKFNDSWFEIPNLWGAVVGEPGAMKTPAVSEGLRFVREIEASELAAFAALRPKHAFDKESREAEKKVIRRELEEILKPKARRSSAIDVDREVSCESLRQRYEHLEMMEDPKPTRLWTSDATTEKLGELLNDNPRGLINIRDELAGLFENLNKPGREGDRQFFLEAWNGQGEFNVDRIGRGSIRIKNLTLSIFGTIQPAVIDRFLKESIAKGADDGLVQRFQLLVFPDPPGSFHYVDRAPRGVEQARMIFERLYNLDTSELELPRMPRGAGEQIYLQFDPDAQKFFESWLTDLETALRDGSFVSSLLQGHMAKFRGLMPSLALIFQLIENASSSAGVERISYSNALLAAQWCSFLQKHAERLYGMSIGNDLAVARLILDRIRSGFLTETETISGRQIYRKCWAGLSVPKEVNSGLEVLSEYGWLLRKTGASGRTEYIVHGGQ